jgi:tetratricopeptide (TPR) repeat protein
MNLTDEQLSVLTDIVNFPADDFNALVRIVGLRPDTDFLHADLSGIDFGTADLRGFRFDYADLSGCNLTRAIIDFDASSFPGANTNDAKWPSRSDEPDPSTGAGTTAAAARNAEHSKYPGSTRRRSRTSAGRSLSRSDFVEIPKLNWPAEFSKQGIEMPDSMLLRPENRIVRCHRLREPLRDTIITWALDDQEFFKLRLQVGEGGTGKTRLLIEVCDRLERRHGWRAGFVDRSQFVGGFSALLKEGKPCLVVLDYAESRTSLLVELIRAALNMSGSPRVRVVLLAREGGDWWDRLAAGAGSDVAVSAILRGLNTMTGPYRMGRERVDKIHRASVFGEALQDFAAYKNVPVPSVPLPDLSDDVFGNILFIHLAALAYLRGAPGIEGKELLATALGHERSYWRQLMNADDIPQMLPGLEQALALLTLCGGKRTAKEAKAVVDRTPGCRDMDPLKRGRLFDTLRRLYPLDGGISGLRPDLLGETLISEQLARDDEILDAALDEETGRGHARHVLTVLTRLGRRVPAEQRWLSRALERHLTTTCEDALYVGMETGAPMPEILAKVIQDADQHERRRVVDILRTKLPDETVNLTKLGIEVTSQSIAFLVNKKAGSESKRHIALFEAFRSLSRTLREGGKLAEAAHAAAEAMQHAEVIFRSDKASDRSKLAGAYGDLAVGLSEVGRFDGALEKAEKAEAIWRALAIQQPDTFGAEWAKSLVNLGTCLSKVGRFEEALENAEKAEGIWRSLAEKQPNSSMAGWATSLANLSSYLSQVGRFAEALENAEKAEGIWRSLAEKQPNSFMAGWATSLANLSNYLSGVGRFEEALANAEKAEGIRSALAEKRSDTFTADWGTSLADLGSRLRDIGRFEEALENADRAESIMRALAEIQPDAFTADWAMSLANLSSHLSDVGRFEEAFEKAEKAESIRRLLAEKQPDTFTADWATSLSHLASCLSEVGRFEEALGRAEKAEAIWRALAEKQPDVFAAPWATSLVGLADAQLAAKRLAVALDTAKQATSQIHPLADQYPPVYNPWLGFAYRVVAEVYFNLYELDEAVSEARRSVELWEEVAKLRPNHEALQVAKSFRVLMKCQIALGQQRAAIATLKRAFDVLRKPLIDNLRPLKPVMSELVDLGLTVDGDSARLVPTGLLQIVASGSL